MSSTVFDPYEFLLLANAMLNDNKYQEQARIRTAIGRAYYAAFLQTRAKLQQMGLAMTEGISEHKQVTEHLRSKDHNLSSQYHRLFRYRVDSDYKPNVNLTIHTGRSALQLAQYIWS